METETPMQVNEDTIYAMIKRECDDYYSNSIQVVDGYYFDTYATIKRIHLYLNSQFESGGYFLNRQLLFFNIVNAPCEIAARMLNLDTKNIRLWAQNPKSYFSTWLLEKELKLWLKRSKMGKILNRIAEETPQYGTIVLEKTKKGAELIDLRRIALDPTVDSIKKSRFVTTIHYMTPDELRKTTWAQAKVEEVIAKYGNKDAPPAYEDGQGNINMVQSSPYIKIHRRFGAVPEGWLDGTNKKNLVKAVFICAGIDEKQITETGDIIADEGITLFKAKWNKEFPFKDFHYIKRKGRWLGVGIVEMLFGIQERINELKNLKRFSMEISTVHLFQTKDKTIVRNILTDLQTGDVLYSPNGIEPIVNEERNLDAFKDEEESYKQQADRLSFAFEAVSGEPMQSSTPATNALLANQSATSVFGFKRENLALFYQEFFNDLVLPQLMNDLTPEHIMRFTGSAQELLKLDMAAAEIDANDFVKQKMLSGDIVTPEGIELFKEERIKAYKQMGEARYLKLKDAFYDDAEFEFDFIISNEQADPATLVQNTQAVLQAVASNPALLEDPRTKMLIYKFAEYLGVSPAEIELADQQANNLPSNQNQNGNPNNIQVPEGTEAGKPRRLPSERAPVAA